MSYAIFRVKRQHWSASLSLIRLKYQLGHPENYVLILTKAICIRSEGHKYIIPDFENKIICLHSRDWSSQEVACVLGCLLLIGDLTILMTCISNFWANLSVVKQVYVWIIAWVDDAIATWVPSRVGASASFLAEISVRSPHKIFIFII